jgi:hypothetical protein
MLFCLIYHAQRLLDVTDFRRYNPMREVDRCPLHTLPILLNHHRLLHQKLNLHQSHTTNK